MPNPAGSYTFPVQDRRGNSWWHRTLPGMPFSVQGDGSQEQVMGTQGMNRGQDAMNTIMNMVGSLNGSALSPEDALGYMWGRNGAFDSMRNPSTGQMNDEWKNNPYWSRYGNPDDFNTNARMGNPDWFKIGGGQPGAGRRGRSLAEQVRNNMGWRP